MDNVGMIPVECAVCKAATRHVFPKRYLPAALDIFPALTLEDCEFPKVVNERCGKELLVRNSSLLHAFENLKGMGELASTIKIEIGGIDDLCKKFQQPLHWHFAKDRLLILLAQPRDVIERLFTRPVLNGKSAVFELTDRGDLSQTPNVIVTAFLELPLNKNYQAYARFCNDFCNAL